MHDELFLEPAFLTDPESVHNISATTTNEDDTFSRFSTGFWLLCDFSVIKPFLVSVSGQCNV